MPGPLTRRLSRILPIIEWGGSYQRSDLKSDLAAGLTVGAMLVPQAMVYAISPECRDVDEAVIENVRCNVRRLRDDDGALGRAIAKGRVVVRGAVHDLVSGELHPVEEATR